MTSLLVNSQAANSPAVMIEKVYSFTGLCDGSAAVALDHRHFAVADDETNVVRVYQLDGKTEPISFIDLTEHLDVDPEEPETDIEGAARIGNKIYWITSHGRNKNAKRRPSRHRLFATEIIAGAVPSLKPPRNFSKSFLEDLLKEKRFDSFPLKTAEKLAPKAEGGFNIEGLAAWNSTQLLVGLRNPVPEGKALLFEVTNPEAAMEGQKTVFGKAHQLDLDGFGVRDIFQVDDFYLILAGPTDGSSNFRIFRWDGKQGLKALSEKQIFEGYNPEAIFQFPGSGPEIFHVVSDDGTVKSGGKECKDLEDSEKRFRLLQVRIEH
ncbi:MAG: DUF3616 domain-containing protein [Verrucomicrobiota bacterium]|nr:DUF3616 domain-containing protein [Verrucomicrobiota bacterium]